MTSFAKARGYAGAAIYNALAMPVPDGIDPYAPLNAALSAFEEAGFVLVPREPTETMHAAAEREWDGRMSARSAGVYKAMIAAAITERT